MLIISFPMPICLITSSSPPRIAAFFNSYISLDCTSRASIKFFTLCTSLDGTMLSIARHNHVGPKPVNSGMNRRRMSRDCTLGLTDWFDPCRKSRALSVMRETVPAEETHRMVFNTSPSSFGTFSVSGSKEYPRPP